MLIGILKESGSENRVAMLPGEAASLKKLGVEVFVETDAGKRAFASDGEYQAAGVSAIIPERCYFKSRHLFLSVNPVPEDDLKFCREGQVLCSVLNPVENS